MLQSIFVALFNIPLFVMGWRSVSKRFAILSLGSVILQVGLIALFQFMLDNGFDLLKDLDVENHEANKLILAIVGGILCGMGCAIPLRCGSSTGGMDIVSQSFSFKTGIPFTYISGALDAIIIISGAIIGADISIAIFTIIRLIVHVITLDKIHTIYKYQKISIITADYVDEIKAAMDAKVFDQPIRDRGISLVTFVVESVTLDEESEQKIDSYELSANTRMQQGTLTGAYAQAVKDAANNEGGAMNGFMGVGMMNMASGGMIGGAATNAFNNTSNTNAGAGAFCGNCGNPTNGTNFCTNCGARLK
jgi:uncharacterized membrane protein YczE